MRGGLASRRLAKAVLGNSDDAINRKVAVLSEERVNPLYVGASSMIAAFDSDAHGDIRNSVFDEYINFAPCAIVSLQQGALCHNGVIVQLGIDAMHQLLKVVCAGRHKERLRFKTERSLECLNLSRMEPGN